LNGKWAEDSTWTGFVKESTSDGKEQSAEVEVTITSRAGNKFEGRFKNDVVGLILGFDGTITGTTVRWRFTKIVASKRSYKNVVGQEVKGRIRRDTKRKETVLDVEYVGHDPDNASVSSRGRMHLTLQE
jgi:hypothetical protein